MRSRIGPLVAVVALLALVAGGASLALAADERWPRMTITPFNYDLTTEAQETVYDIIGARRDLVIHHIDDGVPWPEAYAGLPYHPNVEANLADRLANTPDDLPVFVAVTPLSNTRNDMAGYWAEGSHGPRPGEWADKTFDDPMVMRAYVNYCLDMIERFDPAYFNFAIEGNELGVANPDAYAAFRALIAHTYDAIKEAHPGMPVFISNVLKHPDSAFMSTARPLMSELSAYSDWMAVSMYPYLWLETDTPGNPANVDPRWLSQAADLAPDKPFAVAETGWLAETLWVPELFLWVDGSEIWQDDYLDVLFAELDRLEARFVVWFLAVDYDRAWTIWEALGIDPGFKVWRDTGLYDGDVVPRASRDSWDALLADPLVPLPPPTPGGRDAAGAPVRVEEVDGGGGGGDLRITWDVATCPAVDYHLVWTRLGGSSIGEVVDETCLASSTGSWEGPAPGGSVAVLVVSNDGDGIEGSHGVDSRGHERPTRSLTCGFARKITDGVCSF